MSDAAWVGVGFAVFVAIVVVLLIIVPDQSDHTTSDDVDRA